MPLLPGRSRRVLAANIHELTVSKTKAGRAWNAGPNAHARNVAIALKAAHYRNKGR